MDRERAVILYEPPKDRGPKKKTYLEQKSATPFERGKIIVN